MSEESKAETLMESEMETTSFKEKLFRIFGSGGGKHMLERGDDDDPVSCLEFIPLSDMPERGDDDDPVSCLEFIPFSDLSERGDDDDIMPRLEFIPFSDMPERGDDDGFLPCLELIPFSGSTNMMERGHDEIESRVLSKRKRNDDSVPCLESIPFSDMPERGDDDGFVPCLELIPFSGSINMMERGRDEIESRVLSKRRKNDDSVPCLESIPFSGMSARGDDEIESRVLSKQKRNDDSVPCLEYNPFSGSTVMSDRGDDEIDTRVLSKRKRNDDSMPCLDIIPFSENKHLRMIKKKMLIMKKKKKARFDMEPRDSSMWMEKIMRTHQSEDFKRAMKKYLKDVDKSGGFDIRHEPPAAAPGHKISRIYDPPNIVPKFYVVESLRCLANLAICVYNKNKGTNYDNVQVVMAMRYGCRDEYYNITFKASVPENTVIFETKACLILHRPYQIAEIKFVREFNGKDREEEESDVFGEDSEKLPLHLSEFALKEYNLDQLASSGFTMKQDEMYGGVNVLSWRRKRISIYEGSTYSIKFEASLPKSTVVNTFRTKLLVCFRRLSVKLEIKYIKSKCPTN